MIAAFVSGLNGCDFCFGAHTRIAKSYGVDSESIASLLLNIEESAVDASLMPILKYVKVLTETPTKVTQELVDNILAAGWDESAIYDAACVCALFNFMNRILREQESSHGLLS